MWSRSSYWAALDQHHQHHLVRNTNSEASPQTRESETSVIITGIGAASCVRTSLPGDWCPPKSENHCWQVILSILPFQQVFIKFLICASPSSRPGRNNCSNCTISKSTPRGTSEGGSHCPRESGMQRLNGGLKDDQGLNQQPGEDKGKVLEAEGTPTTRRSPG